MHIAPLVIPAYLVIGYVAALTLAAIALVVWTVADRPVGRHRMTAAAPVKPVEDIDPAPELAAPAPRDALDPAMPLSDIEALMESIVADAAKIEPMPQRIPGAALAASMAGHDTHELAVVA